MILPPGFNYCICSCESNDGDSLKLTFHLPISTTSDFNVWLKAYDLHTLSTTRVDRGSSKKPHIELHVGDLVFMLLTSCNLILCPNAERLSMPTQDTMQAAPRRSEVHLEGHKVPIQNECVHPKVSFPYYTLVIILLMHFILDGLCMLIVTCLNFQQKLC